MPTPTEPRGYQVFIRGPVGFNTHAFGTEAAYRNDVRHQPFIVDFPEPVDNQPDDFGIQGGGGFTLEIADEPDDRDWFLLLEDLGFLLLEDGSGRLIQEY